MLEQFSILNSLLLALMVGVAGWRSRGTTLTLPVIWAGVTVGCYAWGAWNHFSAAATYMAGAASFCPALALLGAKRPQHQAWNAVVLTLLGLLIYPVVQSLVIRPGEPFDVGTVWPWLLLAMICVAPVLYFGTRYSFAALVLGVAQGLFFFPSLPFTGGWGADWMLRPHVSGWIMLLAAVLAEVQFHRNGREFHPADVIWLDFRDSFGLFWGLRWSERINEEAERFQWPVRLEWNGFVVFPADLPISLTDALDQAFAAQLRPTMRGVLRRFVDPNWIESRWGEFAAKPSENETEQSK